MVGLIILLLSLSCTSVSLTFTISLQKTLLNTVFSRVHLSTTVFKPWYFVCKNNLEKTKNHNKTPTILPL